MKFHGEANPAALVAGAGHSDELVCRLSDTGVSAKTPTHANMRTHARAQRMAPSFTGLRLP